MYLREKNYTPFIMNPTGKAPVTRSSNGFHPPEGLEQLMQLQHTIESYGEQPCDPNDVRQELLNVIDTQRIAYEELLGPMVQAVQQQLQLKSLGINPEIQNAKDIVESCEKIRLHMIAVALLNGKLGDNPSAIIDKKPVTNIVKGLGGLAYGKIDNDIIILMPRLKNVAQCNLITQELIQVFESSKYGNNWIMDFSCVREFPSIMFLGTIVGYQRHLSQKNAKLSVAWLKASTITPQLRNSLVSALMLREIHNHLFSKNLLP